MSKTCQVISGFGKFGKAVWFVLRVREGGMVAAGPQCSTWIFIALNHTKRHIDIWGDTSRKDVREANQCNVYMAQLIRIMTSRQLFWLIEQPEGSRYFKLPPMETVLTEVNHTVIKTWLGHWGNHMPKPTMLVGNIPKSFHHLHKPKPANLKMGYGAEKKGRWVSGTKNLAGSAMYPERFVEEYASLFSKASPLTKDECADESVWEPLSATTPLAKISRAGGVKDFVDRQAAASGSMKLTDFFKKGAKIPNTTSKPHPGHSLQYDLHIFPQDPPPVTIDDYMMAADTEGDIDSDVAANTEGDDYSMAADIDSDDDYLVKGPHVRIIEDEGFENDADLAQLLQATVKPLPLSTSPVVWQKVIVEMPYEQKI